MGRIKSLMIKRAAKQLMALKNANFSASFGENKKILSNKMPSKSVRNKIAGYLSRLTLMKQTELKKQESIKAQPLQPEQDIQVQ